MENLRQCPRCRRALLPQMRMQCRREFCSLFSELGAVASTDGTCFRGPYFAALFFRVAAAFFAPLERVGDVRARPWPLARSRLAFCRVFEDELPFLGGLNLTPERRASDRPIATACFLDLMLRSPRFILCISSRTNSPAWVVGFFPLRAALAARALVVFAGIVDFRRLRIWRARWRARGGSCRAPESRRARVDLPSGKIGPFNWVNLPRRCLRLRRRGTRTQRRAVRSHRQLPQRTRAGFAFVPPSQRST